MPLIYSIDNNQILKFKTRYNVEYYETLSLSRSHQTRKFPVMTDSPNFLFHGIFLFLNILKSTILENKANKAGFLEKSTLNRKTYTLNIENSERVHKSFSFPPINGLF